jgi:hypothetical protein
MTLNFYVNHQSLTINPAQKDIEVVADSKNYLKAKFVFQTSEWKDFTPIGALFTHNGDTYLKLLGTDGLAPNECYVSPEVIKTGSFSVSLCGGDFITTDTVNIKVKPSGYTTNIKNMDATPSVLEQHNELMFKYASLCNDILKECQRIQKEIEGGKK